MKRADAPRRAACWLCCALCAALLAGCAADAAQNAPASAQGKHKVMLVAKSVSTEFWKSVFAGADAAATEYNLDLNITGAATEEDYAGQTELVAKAVANGAEALVFSAIDYEANAAAIDAAARAGVQVVAIDSGVHSSAVSAYIGTDNYAAGQMAARAALDSGYDRIVVGLVNYDVNSANGQERERAVRDTLAGDGRVTIAAAINTLALAANARADTAAMLAAYPEINTLIAFNEPTAVGAARAVRERGLGGATWLVGFDSNVETIDKLQTGEVDALIVQNPYAMGYLGVESAYKLLSGQKNALPATLDTATTTVERENMFTVDSQKALFAFE